MRINPRLWMGLLAAALTYLVLTAFAGFGNRQNNGFCGRGDWHSQHEEARPPENFRND